jgi:hypothetical protein
MIKIFLLFISIFISINGFSQFENYFENRTLRLDYFHSGNYEHEYYRTDELIEKNTWAGSKINLIDTFNYGKFKIMVYDTLSGKLIYSRSYSSLFAEWRTTSEGKGSCGNFSETMLIPYPKKVVKVCFQSRDSLNKWHFVESQIIDPEKDFISKPLKNNIEIIPLHFAGKTEDKLDIAIIADGYSIEDIEKMKKDFEKFNTYLLNAIPFNENAAKINIWGVAAISEQSGITDPKESLIVKTAVNSSFNTINSDRYLMTLDNKSLHNALSNVAYDQIIIMCNTTKYGGGGIYNFYSTAAAGNSNTNFLIQHEFGHAFAGLGDEYYTSDVSVEDFYPLEVEPWEPNITTLVNFDEKWKDLLGKDAVIPTPPTDSKSNLIGVYEGAGYMSKGLYRPYLDCTMKSIKYNAYCPVCKRAVQRMIDFYSR